MKNILAALLVLLGAITLAAQSSAPESHGAAGEEKSAHSMLLSAGSELLQSEGPVRAIHAHLCGFHFYAGDQSRAVRAHHYCTHLNEEVFQCVIYDSDRRDARLIGIEYVISERLFRELPADEKKLWHSHRYEVMSGQLVAPNLPDAAEQALMKDLVTTYGKTWHTWQVDRGDKLPLGGAELMMSFTADGQADPAMIAARDRDLRIDSSKDRAQRADIPTRPIVEGADAWQKVPAK